jgi:hypothetical protein
MTGTYEDGKHESEEDEEKSEAGEDTAVIFLSLPGLSLVGSSLGFSLAKGERVDGLRVGKSFL